MKTLEEIKKDYTKEDRDYMLKAQNQLQVFEVKEDKKGLQYYEKASKRELKKADCETFYSWLYRATFHMTAVREIDWKYYFFRNCYSFE